MKIFNLLIGIIFAVASFAVQPKVAEAQCGQGYTPYVHYMQIGNCTYKVEICFKCPTGPVPGEVQIIGLTRQDFNCTPSFPFQTVLEIAQGQVSNWDFIQDVLCLSLPENPPPCPDNANIYTVHSWLCWSKEIIEYFGEIQVHYGACYDGGYCEATYSYCYDPFQDKNIKTLITTEQVGPNCVELDQIPPGDIPQNYGEPPSPCFQYHTECNP